MSGGYLDRHLRRARRIYRARHDLVAGHIARIHADGLIPPPPRSNAGLHQMIELHPDSDASALATRLAVHGIVVETTADCWTAAPRPGLTIGFGLADTDRLTMALERLGIELRRRGD